jgi:hypothetical protein
VITDSGKPHVIDWSGKPDPKSVQWVALFSDLDHAIKPVTSGSRVTLVYSLSRSDRPRTDAARDKRLAGVRAAVDGHELPKGQPLFIACTRLIVTDGKQPQPIDSLRGTDREIADAFRRGFASRSARLIGDDQEGNAPRFPTPRTSGASPASRRRSTRRCPCPMTRWLRSATASMKTSTGARSRRARCSASTSSTWSTCSSGSSASVPPRR